MSFSVKKENGKLIFIDHGGYESRNPSTFWCIQEADKIYNWNNFKQLTIHTQDYENNINQYTYSKLNSIHNTVPDFTFHAWPEIGMDDYSKLTEQLSNAGLVKPEINKVGWIGAMSNKNRNKLVDLGKKHSNIMDIFNMRWIKTNKVFMNATNYISVPELVKKYTILIDIEGNGWSARLKWLLWSRRPLLLVDRPHKEYFFNDLKEWVHYIPVKRDLSDLVEQTMWCLNNYDQALKIADNALEFSRIHLTREDAYKRWNTVITGL
jgi:hypothetical protein